jgi:SAM-dependent methyltransferase
MHLSAIRRAFRAWYSPRIEDRLWLQQRLQTHALTGPLVRLWQAIRQPTARDYVEMQRRDYERRAAADTISPGEISGDYVVGMWREHDTWPDYEEFLMRYVPTEPTWIALDFGCGPGRNLRRWSHRFARIDGADISARNLENARIFLQDLPAEKKPNLYLTSGMDCGDAPADAYDFAFSTICLQHICVHSVRLSILRALYRCLKPGGRLSIQMGYGPPTEAIAAYHDDFTAAIGTNSHNDTTVSSPDEPRGDLESIGFTGFESCIRPRHPSDQHPEWIFFTAIKPR